MKEHEKKNKILAFEMIIVILISLLAVFATLSFSFNLFTTHTNYSLLNKLITWIDNTDSVTNKNKEISKKRNKGYKETMTGSLITDEEDSLIYNYRDDNSKMNYYKKEYEIYNEYRAKDKAQIPVLSKKNKAL